MDENAQTLFAEGVAQQEVSKGIEDYDDDAPSPLEEDLPEDEPEEDSILLKSDYHQIWFRPSWLGAFEFKEYPRPTTTTDKTEHPPLFQLKIWFFRDSRCPLNTMELDGNDRALMDQAVRQLTSKLLSVHPSYRSDPPPTTHPDNIMEAFKKMCLTTRK